MSELIQNTENEAETAKGKSPIPKSRPNAGHYRFCADCSKADGRRVMHPHDVTCPGPQTVVTRVTSPKPQKAASKRARVESLSNSTSLATTVAKPMNPEQVPANTVQAEGELQPWQSPKDILHDILTNQRTSFNGKHDKPGTLAHRNGTRNIPAEQVLELAAMGCTATAIASQFGVSERAISRRFAATLEKGRAARRVSLRQRQTEIAMSNSAGSTAMCIFLGKNELGQSDVKEISGPNGGPIPLAAYDALLDLRDDERRKKKKRARERKRLS